MNKRVEFIDIMKGIAILLVVIGHCCQLPERPTELVRFIYSFHMPVFFIAAGMFIKSQDGKTIHDRWRGLAKRFLTLLVPYYIWCLIYMDCTMENFGRMFYASFQSIMATGAECRQLWFLPCLFAAEVLMNSALCLATALKTPEKPFMSAVAVLSFVIGFALPKIEGGYPFNFDVAFVAMGIMILGRLGKDMISRLDGLASWAQLPMFLVSAVLLAVGNVYGLNGFMTVMAKSLYGPIFWFMWNACFGVIMVRSFSSIVAKIGDVPVLSFFKGILLWMGRNTIGIFLLHMPLCYWFMPRMENLLGLSIDKWSGNLVIGLVVTLVSAGLAALVNVVCPQIMGKNIGKN